jgi:4-amino-4-deoxy-L-arabinose transferase-like glycosyltransferase
MSRSLLRASPVALVLAAAAVLLTWRLGAVYLWQDEAATAVLADRMLRFGKPLAYDGRNIITMDSFVDEDPRTIGERTGSADAAFRYLAGRHDFRPDGTWVGQPWGQFVAAAAGLAVLGHETAAARLPFALAALATVILLYAFARRTFPDPTVAVLAAALLAANAFWILHARQCRYYALSSLFVLASLAAFARWQRGARWGAPLFALMGWLYFQSDFGSFFPSMAVLGAIALLSRRRPVAEIALTFASLAAAVAPFAWYYGLLDRMRNPIFSWRVRFVRNLINVDEHVIPLLVLIAAAGFLWRGRATIDRAGRDVLWAGLGLTLSMLAWVPTVAPAPFLRYVVQLAPVAALVAAWTIVQVADAIAVRVARRWARPAALAGAAALVGATGILSIPVVGSLVTKTHLRDLLVRYEIRTMLGEVFVPRPDPNREVIQALALLLRPGDEILVNYEDVPFMFYTDARVRGGVAAFRVEDRSVPPPRFAVMRRSVPFVHWDVFEREVYRYRWRLLPLRVPDVPFGNNPDPSSLPLRPSGYEIEVGERILP